MLQLFGVLMPQTPCVQGGGEAFNCATLVGLSRRITVGSLCHAALPDLIWPAPKEKKDRIKNLRSTILISPQDSLFFQRTPPAHLFSHDRLHQSTRMSHD